MDALSQAISQYRWILIAACAVGCVLFLLSGLFALRDLNRIAFRLERSTVISRALGSMLRAVLCLLAGGAIYSVTNAVSRPLPPVAIQPVARASPTPFTIIVPTADFEQAIAVASVAAAATPVTDTNVLPTASLTDAMLVTVTATPMVTTTAIPQIVLVGAPTVAAEQTPTPPASATPLVIPTATSAAGLQTLPTLPPVGEGTQQAPAAAPSATRPPAGTAVIVELPLLPTPTLGPTATPQTAPAAPAVVSGGCRPGELTIYRPSAGETINGSFDIIGDAAFRDGKYRIDVVPANESAWRFIFENFKKVQGESLMPPRFQTGIFPNGSYFMKLTLVDPAGNEQGNCVVPFNIGN
jgi:hypothetical protein